MLYRLLLLGARRCAEPMRSRFYSAAWAVLGDRVLKAQHAVEDAEDNLEFITDVVAEEAARLVKEIKSCSSLPC